MGTRSATPSGPQQWVRGPNPPQHTPPEPRPVPDGDVTDPMAGIDGHTAAPAVPVRNPLPPEVAAGPGGEQTFSSAQGGQSATPVSRAAAVPAAAVPLAQAAVQAAPRPAGPVAPRPPAPISSQAAPVHRAAPVPTAEATRGESNRPDVARGKSRDEVGWVKAHGGAGASALAEALGGVDVGARWPQPARGEPHRVVLVGRTSARGLQSVSQALAALQEANAPQGLDLLGVVLVADAPGLLPLSLLRRIRVLRSVTRVYRVPWIPAWRTGGRPKYLHRRLATLATLVGSDLYGEGAVS